MAVKPYILSTYQRVDKVRGDVFKKHRRAVLFIILTDQLTIGSVQLRTHRHAWVFDVIHIRRVAKQPKEVNLDSAKEYDDKIYKYQKIP